MDDDNNLDIFQMTIRSTKPTKDFVERELLLFQCYHMDVKEIKCPFQWWDKHEAMFPIVRFLTCQILRIVGSQIETERIFSLARILNNLKRCLLQ